MSDLEGVMLSDYFLVECISKGGVADVYRARQNGEGNYEVAVKVFRSGYAQRESFRDYFMTEAEKIGQFDHPNILPFLEFGEGEDLLYVVTLFVANGTLDALLKRVDGKFSAMQALPIIQQLCNAVQYAHDHNVIHGNIKPTNVFVAADGRMLLSDFGIARGFDDSQQSLTRIGWGSAEYAAPEQSLGVLRRASDIYSLGVLLFRILTGHLPFTGQTPVEVLLKHVRQPSPSARSLAPNISDAVDSVLRMAMQKRSDDRFASVEEFSNALLAAVTVAPVASAVAKSVVGVAAQPAQTQSPLGDPKTRLPALSQSQVIGDPQTPVPAYLALTPPVVSPVPQELSPLTTSSQESPQQPEVPNPEEGSGSDITDKYPKSFLEENDDDAGTHLFWSVDPVEWSPIEGDQEASVPANAADYLRSMPMVPEASPPAPPTASPSPPQKDEGKSRTPFNTRLEKLLPALVVVLLVIGLLGALLSSFLFPSEGPSMKSSQISSNATTGLRSATATVTLSPTHVKTAIPAAKATLPYAPTVVATQPVLTPTPLPTNPPVPAFSCTAGAITMDGSANLQPAMQQLTTDYYNQCPNTAANFTITANGSKSSLDALANGTVDLAYSDLASTGRSGLLDYQIGALMYAVIVNNDTQVAKLTTAQLQGIYTGQITNWSQVGGVDEPITIINRSTDSAIRAIFETYVLKGVAQSVPGSSPWFDSSGEIAREVLSTNGAISYLPLAAAPSGVQNIAIDGVDPTASSVSTNAYRFWSIAHLYTHQVATGLGLSFISLCSTETGAGDLTNNGVVPLKQMSQAALNSHTPGPTV